MLETVLIPGYATEFSTLFRPARGADGGFSAFAHEIASHRAVVYRWGIREHVSLWRAMNPFYLLNLYRRERQLAVSQQTLQGLQDFLLQHTPRTIVCHSMGCLVLMEYLKTFVLPSSVEQIIFIQADLPATTRLQSTVPVKNLFCPWDPTLLLSVVCHRALLAGITGIKDEHIKNKLFPLRRLPNLHTSSIRDRRLLKFL